MIELPTRTAEYKVNDVTYTVSTLFSQNSKEDLAAKIRRLILNDKFSNSDENAKICLGARENP